jgi:DNA-binding transcriptional regulator GbsR (MarR family)
VNDRQFEMQHFVEDVGLFFEQSGLPRMAGRVLGWLLISDPPHQSMNELVDALSASKASISNTTRLLIQLGLIERVSLPGYRPDYYRIKSGAWYQILEERMKRLSNFRQLAERGLALLEAKKPELKTRLQEMHEVYSFFEQAMPTLLERWKQADGTLVKEFR